MREEFFRLRRIALLSGDQQQLPDFFRRRKTQSAFQSFRMGRDSDAEMAQQMTRAVLGELHGQRFARLQRKWDRQAEHELMGLTGLGKDRPAIGVVRGMAIKDVVFDYEAHWKGQAVDKDS